jgi:hypothetical protein
MLAILALGRVRQENHKFEASLAYIVRHYPKKFSSNEHRSEYKRHEKDIFVHKRD